jgi:putative SOS response-associated peptidase YedK
MNGTGYLMNKMIEQSRSTCGFKWMCGKFTIQMTWREFCNLAGTYRDGGDGSAPDSMAPGTGLATMTPARLVPVLHLGPARQRRISAMRWGWHMRGAADPMRRFSHLHARAETIDGAPTWINAFRERRGVIFTRAFNIGEELPSGKTKQWICCREDKSPVAIAVIYEVQEYLQGKLTAFAMVTTQSCAPLDKRDSRMPALLDWDEVPMWLGEKAATYVELKAMLHPYAGVLAMREQDPPARKAERNTTRAKPKPTSDAGQSELF